MVILKSQNKITDFLMILASVWAFNLTTIKKKHVGYLNVISSGISRTVASRFCMGVSLIMMHKISFVQGSVTVCPMCMEEEEEDEIYFIRHCLVYHD